MAEKTLQLIWVVKSVVGVDVATDTGASVIMWGGRFYTHIKKAMVDFVTGDKPPPFLAVF